jgi:hypothetical protein
VTGDEFWFLEYDDLQKIWRVSSDEVSTKGRHTRTTSKTIFTGFFGIRGVIFIH